VQLPSPGVRGMESQRLRIEDPHRLRAGVEEEAVALLARAPRFDHPDAIGDVADGGPQRAPAAVLERSRGDVHHDLRAVLALMARLVRAALPLLGLAQPATIGGRVAPEPIDGRPDQLGAWKAIELAGAVVGVDH